MITGAVSPRERSQFKMRRAVAVTMAPRACRAAASGSAQGIPSRRRDAMPPGKLLPRLVQLIERMPVWIADTESNGTTAARARASRNQSDPDVGHTEIGALTTFTVETDATPESWCLEILDAVAGHHDRYSHSPGYSGLEIYGLEPSPTLLAALAEYRLTDIATFPWISGDYSRWAAGWIAERFVTPCQGALGWAIAVGVPAW